MARETRIITEHHFNDVGKYGIGLLFLSPVISAWAYALLLRELAEKYREPAIGLPIIFLIAGGIGFIAAILMIVIGRIQISTIKRV